MKFGLWGKKLGNTRVFHEGQSLHVSIVRVSPMYMMGIRKEGPHTLMQVAYGDVIKPNKPMAGHFASAQVEPRRRINEYRIDESFFAACSTGSEISTQLLKDVDYLDVSGTTKGHGFTGPVKRHGFSMQPATHGNSLSHRAHGSTGQCQDPGRVFKGKKMAGQHGNVKRTIQNIAVYKVDLEEGLIWIQGAIPGPVGGLVWMTPSFKKAQSLSPLLPVDAGVESSDQLTPTAKESEASDEN